MTQAFKGALIQQSTEVEAAPLQHEMLLFHPKSNRFCILNRTSSFIWNTIKSPMSPEQIADKLSASFSGISPADALKDVEAPLTLSPLAFRGRVT
jgi:hypothetical protein